MKGRSVVPNRAWRGTITANEGGRGKGGTIGMLKSVMRGSGKFIATQPKSSNLLLPPSPLYFFPQIPEMKMYNVHVPGESQSKPNIIHL